MSSVHPVQNNNAVLPIRGVVPNPLDLKLRFEEFNTSFVNKLSGIITPTVAGTYPILDSNGNPLILPASCLVLAAGMRNMGLALTTGTNVLLETTESTPSVILPAQTIATINTGVILAPTTAHFGPNAYGVVAVTTGTFAVGTQIYVNIFYLHLD